MDFTLWCSFEPVILNPATKIELHRHTSKPRNSVICQLIRNHFRNLPSNSRRLLEFTNRDADCFVPCYLSFSPSVRSHPPHGAAAQSLHSSFLPLPRFALPPPPVARAARWRGYEPRSSRSTSKRGRGERPIARGREPRSGDAHGAVKRKGEKTAQRIQNSHIPIAYSNRDVRIG